MFWYVYTSESYKVKFLNAGTWDILNRYILFSHMYHFQSHGSFRFLISSLSDLLPTNNTQLGLSYMHITIHNELRHGQLAQGFLCPWVPQWGMSSSHPCKFISPSHCGFTLPFTDTSPISTVASFSDFHYSHAGRSGTSFYHALWMLVELLQNSY